MSSLSHLRSNTNQWPIIAIVCSIAAAAAHGGFGDNLPPAGIAPAKADEKPTFKGMWDGSYVDDDDPSMMGKGTYEFHDEKESQLKVTVSWKVKAVLKKMELQGQRLGLDAIRLEGKYDGTTYRYMGRMTKGKLVLYYLSIDESGKSGSLSRPSNQADLRSRFERSGPLQAINAVKS